MRIFILFAVCVRTSTCTFEQEQLASNEIGQESQEKPTSSTIDGRAIETGNTSSDINIEFAGQILRGDLDDQLDPDAHARLVVRVLNGELLLQILQNGASFVPQTREWQNHSKISECVNCYPTNIMMPFLRPSVRLNSVIFSIDDRHPFTPYTLDHITTLESISHVWSGQTMTVNDWSANDQTSLSLILNSSAILKCRTLKVFDVNVRMDLLNNSSVYRLNEIDYQYLQTREQIVQIIKQKATNPKSDTIVVLYPDPDEPEEIVAALEIIRKHFLESSDLCRLRVIVAIRSDSKPPENLEFRIENIQTNEVLQATYSAKDDIKINFEVTISRDQALILERFNL
ncbi:hypothetical protein DdX_16932 [Ditylenchus destructor]|uniref:Uncharacterized protein n=1 Tax=Ditylenchus destructor TaxID=166010 RepID=A0AAD4MN33_9BILA|nr:hypothetical protein DdX_16932 [Ditylenchus destructor]